MPYHGENAVRPDQRPLTWMGSSGFDSSDVQNETEQNFHAGYPYNGPTGADLECKLAVSLFHTCNKVEQEKLERNLQLMRYTHEGEGCRALKRDSYGRTSSIRPGCIARLPNTATSAIEAAEATKFYPHQEYKIMAAAMICGPGFPFPKPKAGGSQEYHIDGSKRNSTAAFFAVLGTTEIFENILSNLCYTDRAALSQSCPEATVGITNSQTVWYVNQQNLAEAEFLDEEFKHIVEAGEKWNVTAPRGAKVLMVTMAARDYVPSTGYRPYSSYMKIAAGMLRFLRAMDNRGCYVEHLTLKNVPFVDHKVLAGIVEFCPKLRKLEIPGCEQFTLFSVAPFLKFLKDIQKKRGKHIHFDVAPTFYKGVRWMDYSSERMHQSTHDRKGTFGVTASDPGCDIPMAVCKVLVYHILPAMKAAGQLHMIYDYSSLFRQWNEALPAPRSCIPLILGCWEVDEMIENLRAAAEWEWSLQSRGPDEPTTFDRESWPDPMKQEVVQLETLRHWIIVRATCGDNGWKQTADRGFYSCDYQCTAGNFEEHSRRMLCEKCKVSLPRIFFNSGFVCEGCRLEVRVVYRENDHLQYLKRQATAALGYGTIYEPFRSNAESNFPFDAFKPDENGELPVKTRADFVRIVNSAPSLRRFIDTAMLLDNQERLAGYYKGRKTTRQLDHPWANTPTVNATVHEVLARHPYRRALTHEEYAVSDGRGWEPANKDGFLRW